MIQLPWHQWINPEGYQYFSGLHHWQWGNPLVNRSYESIMIWYYNPNKTKHNKTMFIFYGPHCIIILRCINHPPLLEQPWLSRDEHMDDQLAFFPLQLFCQTGQKSLASSPPVQLWQGACCGVHEPGERGRLFTYMYTILTQWNSSNLGFPGISWRTHGGNSLKYDMLLYPDHLQNWLDYGYGLVIFLILVLFIHHIPGKCMSQWARTGPQLGVTK